MGKTATTDNKGVQSMSPTLKRVITAVAVKKAFDAFQERRQPPKRSLVARLAGPTLALAAAGGVAYLGISGRLGPLTGKAKSLAGGRSSQPYEESSTAAQPAEGGSLPTPTV
jgi:hypothetical protein